MATSSISSDIKWANSKLAEILRQQEDEELARKVGRSAPEPKVREDIAHKKRRARREHVKADRWTAPVNFAAPSPLTDRPRTESGATTFHFSVRTVSKHGSPTSRGKPLAGFQGGSKSPGADHELYIGREGAPEVHAAIHTFYIERERAVEIDPTTLDRTPDGAYADEIGDDFDDNMLARDARGVPSIFSNISDDPMERAAFWQAVHAAERSPKVHQIVINVAKDREWAEAARHNPDLPSSLQVEIGLALVDHDHWLRGKQDKPFRPRTWTGDADACGQALLAARQMPPYGDTPALTFKSGRGGTVQHRFVVELPHELNAAERAALVKRFCNHLGSLETTKDGTTRGMMYTAAIHAPDAHNDIRNYHLHVIAHDRPAQFRPEFGQWDFEVAEVFERKSEIRTRYPYRQQKIAMVRQSAAKTGNDDGGRNFIPAMRKVFAEMTNEALERAGIERRYDHRSYAAMGIDRTPTEHLGTRLAALEAAGVETKVGALNAQIIWADAERTSLKRCEQRKAAHTTALQNLSKVTHS